MKSLSLSAMVRYVDRAKRTSKCSAPLGLTRPGKKIRKAANQNRKTQEYGHWTRPTGTVGPEGGGGRVDCHIGGRDNEIAYCLRMSGSRAGERALKGEKK